ncbi:unnamed protein product [Agarophyton chilense]
MTISSITLLAALISFSQAYYYKDVNAKDFDRLLDPEKASIMLEFYAPWCGHCKSLAPEYEKLGSTFKRSKDVVIAQINADAHKELGDRFKVQGFPTLKWIQKGSTFESAEDIKVARTASALLDFVIEKTGVQKSLKDVENNIVEFNPSSFDIATKSPAHHTFVIFVEPSQACTTALQIWNKVGDLFSEDEHIVVAKVDGDRYSALAAEQDVSMYPTFKYYGKGGTQKFEDELSSDSLMSFINDVTGMDVTIDDGVLPSAGKILEISEQIQSFVKAKTEEQRVQLMDTCKVTVEKLNEKAKEDYKYYSKVFSKISEKGMAYISKEKARLSSLLEDVDNIQRSQRRKFMKNLNVLKEFTEL